ncbi:MOSC domain-containing protein [Herbiconiux sp. CPCC 205763]|uniref:MOSC domain-containing protein n=1 Tax=Herbiconiux aconitum TaxID=2970913 RepID=A0ABT2GSM5_9MICO|nr:MOSC domain-containing protein [Herbiconiux aconitum]MCS5719136.1 MOSC domain-containing protein [Herbiconiux aconitum]
MSAGELVVEYPVEIVHLLVSSVHRYEGRPADGPLPVPPGEIESRSEVEVREGLGIVGDRYFGRPAHKRAAVTVMAAESLDAVQALLGVAHPFDLGATRRNITLRGVDVDALAGVEFSLDSGSGPVLFRGHRPANPCAWMNVTLAPGAHKALRGRGGVRSEPLSTGVLSLGPAVLRVADALGGVEPLRS